MARGRTVYSSFKSTLLDGLLHTLWVAKSTLESSDLVSRKTTSTAYGRDSSEDDCQWTSEALAMSINRRVYLKSTFSNFLSSVCQTRPCVCTSVFFRAFVQMRPCVPQLGLGGTLTGKGIFSWFCDLFHKAAILNGKTLLNKYFPFHLFVL